MTELQQKVIDLFFTNGKYDARRVTPAKVLKMPELGLIEGKSISEKVWLLFHTRPNCHCGNKTKFIDQTLGYRPYCSRKCIQSSPFNEFTKRRRHEKLWRNPEWAAETSLKMRESHFKSNGAKKLAKIAEKEIVPLDEVTSDRRKLIRWQHVCGEVFVKTFERPSAVYCPKCHVSQGQGELFELIRRNYSGKIIVNDRRAIAPKEIDIYLPEIKVGFEFNGKYWHPGDGSRERFKTDEADAVGIQIMHIWEIEWKKDREPIKAAVLCLIKSQSF